MNIAPAYALGIVWAVAFTLTLIALPPLIRKLQSKGFVSGDMNKEGNPKVAKIGGIAIFLGFIVAFLLPLQLTQGSIAPDALLAAALSISLIAFLGLADDLLDIPDVYRVILPLFAALPLMLVKVGTYTMSLPFLGTVNLSLGTVALPFLGPVGLNVYVLLLIPIGVIACSNLINLLAGFNGLEAGTGAIICAFLIIILLMDGNSATQLTALFLATALLGALLAFLIFNWYPAKIFPGNITTYLIGASIAAIAIIGNIEKAGAILLLPQITEFFLKALSKFQAENYGTPSNGRLTYSGPTRSLTHLLMKMFRPTEVQLVLMLYAIQIAAGLLALAAVVLHI
ncbi:MAG: hypothetical protein N3G76_00510 [Candidatus Micrarchaeota archaeon]|nr:hypothetical protein [Candidatus Micrarchaeota archaeon]